MCLGSTFGEERMLLFGAAALALSAVPLWVIGELINIKDPKKKLDAFIEQRKAELDQTVAEGTFHLGEGHLPPASLAEAKEQAAWKLQQEVEYIQQSGGMKNRHTLFFIPAQYYAFVAAALGISLFFVALFK